MSNWLQRTGAHPGALPGASGYMVTLTHYLKQFLRLWKKIFIGLQHSHFYYVWFSRYHIYDPIFLSLKRGQVDANLFIQALVLSPSPCQGYCALFIDMESGRQKKKEKGKQYKFLLLSHRYTTLHFKSIASLSPLCRAQVCAIWHTRLDMLPPETPVNNRRVTEKMGWKYLRGHTPGVLFYMEVVWWTNINIQHPDQTPLTNE